MNPQCTHTLHTHTCTDDGGHLGAEKPFSQNCCHFYEPTTRRRLASPGQSCCLMHRTPRVSPHEAPGGPGRGGWATERRPPGCWRDGPAWHVTFHFVSDRPMFMFSPIHFMPTSPVAVLGRKSTSAPVPPRVSPPRAPAPNPLALRFPKGPIHRALRSTKHRSGCRR